MLLEDWLVTPEGIEYTEPWTECSLCLTPMDDIYLCDDCYDFICARVSGCPDPAAFLCGDLECIPCNEYLTD